MTWPKRGMTQAGYAFELPTLAPRTDGSACFALLGTPSAADAMGGHLSRGGSRSHELLLKGQVKALLPTPVANDDNKTAEAHLSKKVASGAGEVITSLTVMARQAAETGRWANKLLPTPTGDDANNVTRAPGSFQYLSRTVHNLEAEAKRDPNGESTSPPFDGGSTPGETPHHGQLTIEDA